MEILEEFIRCFWWSVFVLLLEKSLCRYFLRSLHSTSLFTQKKWKFTNITRNKEYFFNGIFVFWQKHVNLYDLRYKNCWSLSKLFIIENFNALLFGFYAFKIKLEKFKLVFFNNKFLYNRFQVLNTISTVQSKFYQKVSFPKAINFSVLYKLTMNSACLQIRRWKTLTENLFENLYNGNYLKLFLTWSVVE